jgi:hypothetical protein
VVSIAGTVFSIVVNGALQSIVGFVTEIATIVATLMQVSSMFKPWTVALSAAPKTQTLSEPPQTGAFDATLKAQDIPWPQTLIDCVSALSHVNLTDASYKDAPVTWTRPIGIPTLATNTTQDSTLLDDKTAHYSYTTVTKPNVPAEECPRLLSTGTVGITVTVERTDISKVEDSLVQLIANQLPAKLQTFLQPYEQPAINAAKTAVNKFKAPQAKATVALMEYVPDPLCSRTPPPSSPPPSAPPSHDAQSLPFAACDQILTGGDVEAGYPGMIILDPYLKPEMRALIRNMAMMMIGMAKGQHLDTKGLENEPRIATATSCTIGVEGGDPDRPDVRALFTTLPPEDGPTDPAMSDPECLAALSAELEHFKAKCSISGISARAGEPAKSSILHVSDSGADYAITATTAGAHANEFALMRSILQRLEH